MQDHHIGEQTAARFPDELWVVMVSLSRVEWMPRAPLQMYVMEIHEDL